MFRRLVIASVIFAGFLGGYIAPTTSQDKDDAKAKPAAAADSKFQRGAKPTPPVKIIAAIKGGKAGIYKNSAAAPSQVVVVPKRLSMWGNSQFGDCVSAESVFAIADYSTFVGLDEIFVTEAATIAWARSHGYLNGADLLEVIQSMEADGIKDEKGTLRKAGKPSTVDYSNETTLQSAIAQGPVSIAIDADALPGGAGNASGWSAFGGRNYPNTDHCVSLHGYGPTSELFKALGVPVPAGAPASGYYLYTWSTIGVVDHKWIMNTCVEAWVRNPTTTDLQPPTPPQPQPGNVTVVVANVAGTPGTPVKFSPVASGGTAPYIFLFDYGDSAQDASGQHSYKAAGTYKVTVSAVDSTGSVGVAYCTATISTTPPGPGPGPNPIPGGQGTVLFSDTGTSLDGRPFYLVPQTIGDMRLIDLLAPKSGPKR